MLRLAMPEDDLWVEFAEFFSGDQWDRIHTHLRLQTIDKVFFTPPTNAELQHHEGKRALMGYIEDRINAGRRIKRDRSVATRDD